LYGINDVALFMAVAAGLQRNFFYLLFPCG